MEISPSLQETNGIQASAFTFVNNTCSKYKKMRVSGNFVQHFMHSLFKTLLPLLTQVLIQHSTRLAISNTGPRRAIVRHHYDQIVAWCQMHCPRVVHSTLSLTLSVVIDSNCLSSTLSKHISPSVIGKTLSTTFFPPVGRHFLRFNSNNTYMFPNFFSHFTI